MREQVQTSPVMDATRFTRSLEQGYRQMWRAWCADPEFGFAKRAGPLLLEPLPPEVREPLQPLAPAPLAPSPTEDAIANTQADIAPADVAPSPPAMVTVRGIPMTLNHAMERGYDWHRMGELDTAAEVYQALLAVLPEENADIWSRLGSIHYQRGDFVKAEECLARAVECFGDHPQFHNNLAIARLMLGKPDQAEASCRRALELKPDYIDALNNLGAALEAQSRFISAVECYRRVLEFEPYFAEGHYNLGNALRGAARVSLLKRSRTIAKRWNCVRAMSKRFASWERCGKRWAGMAKRLKNVSRWRGSLRQKRLDSGKRHQQVTGRDALRQGAKNIPHYA